METAARLREHLRVPGMGDTTARHFRDKLAMRRVQARDQGVPVPDFVHVLNHGQVDAFMWKCCPGPWVLKPRSEAGSVGIKKLHHAQEVWDTIETLGDLQSDHLMEQYVAGDVYHVDSIVYDRKILFSQAHRYGVPPFNVWNHGGVFSTKSLDKEAPELGGSLAVNDQVIRAMGLVRRVTRCPEFIRGGDGKLYDQKWRPAWAAPTSTCWWTKPPASISGPSGSSWNSTISTVSLTSRPSALSDTPANCVLSEQAG